MQTIRGQEGAVVFAKRLDEIFAVAITGNGGCVQFFLEGGDVIVVHGKIAKDLYACYERRVRNAKQKAD